MPSTSLAQSGRVGWLVGPLCGVMVCAAVARGAGRAGRDHLLPADLVTLTRVLLACAAAGVVADALPAPPPAAAFLSVVVPALALDAVDGQVARRTGSATAFGARFDGESDAVLVLVLSVAAAPVVGWWVLAAGLARYLFWSSGVLLPWMRRPLPPRHWRKVAAASAGVGLAAAASDVLPRPLAAGVAAAVLVLLAESFGHDVWWLWRRRAAMGRPRGVGVTAGQVGRPLAHRHQLSLRRDATCDQRSRPGAQ